MSAHVVEPDVGEHARTVSQSHFSLPLARSRMMQVHTTGRATVSSGARERMEVDVTAMHSYGLRATLEPVADDCDEHGDNP